MITPVECVNIGLELIGKDGTMSMTLQCLKDVATYEFIDNYCSAIAQELGFIDYKWSLINKMDQ